MAGSQRLIILVTVREAFLHCGKALKRSGFGRTIGSTNRSFPSLGRMIVEQTKPATVTVSRLTHSLRRIA